MGVIMGLSVLLLLSSTWGYVDARDLVMSDDLVMQINSQEPVNKIKTSEASVKNERVCTLCEQFAAQAIEYLGENKTQTEIIEKFHQTCSRLPSFQLECLALVDYYAPLFFVEITLVNPEDFCKKVNLCENVALVSPHQHEDTCTLCHQAIVDLLTKLKDPDTQLEIIEALLKECNKVDHYMKECKKLVFEYGPLILANAEQFLETTDICTAIHICKTAGDLAAERFASMLELPSSK